MAEVCAAMVRLGHDVTMTVPTAGRDVPLDPRDAYGVFPTFPVERLRHFDPWTTLLVPGAFKMLVGTWFYRLALRRYLRAHPADLLYLRSPLLLRTAVRSGAPVILELHTLPRRGRTRFVGLCNECRKVVCLTSPMRGELASWGVAPSRLAVEGDAVDLAPFVSTPSLHEAKLMWRLDPVHPVIGYVGSLVTQDTIQKGVGELLQAFKLLSQRGVLFRGWIVGGPAGWAERYKRMALELGIASLVRFEGRIGADEVPSALAACDALAYPAPRSDHPYFRRDTSPLKIFEYLAARRPIVAADLPPLRDVLDGSVARLCAPGDPASLAQALEDVLKHPQEAQTRVQEGWQRVQTHTWEERMKRILILS
jgi:glycosyltransferase involved in cell wall biosynthesis